MAKKKRRDFRDSLWYTVLMLILFMPLGTYYMWRNDHLPKVVRIYTTGLTGVYIFLMVIAFTLLYGITHEIKKERIYKADEKIEKKEREKKKEEHGEEEKEIRELYKEVVKSGEITIII